MLEFKYYSLNRKYKVKPKSYPWFSPGCTSSFIQRNHFCPLYNKKKNRTVQSATTFRKLSYPFK